MARSDPAGRPSGGLRTLRRRPKTLDAEPTLFDASASGRGPVLGGGKGGRKAAGPAPTFTSGPAGGVTEEQGELSQDNDLVERVDAETLRRSRLIASRLAVPRPRERRTTRQAGGDLTSVRFTGGADEIDVDATLLALVESPFLRAEDVVVREWHQARRSVVLLVDVSGSMKGERIRTAAAAVGALSAELARDRLSVIAFWSDAAVLSTLQRPRHAETLLAELVRLPAQGLTNLAFPLEVAARELSTVQAGDRRVVLLSDCVHNAGPDPRPVAARLNRVDVLLDRSGEHDEELARDIARIGRGRMAAIQDFRQAASALSALFAD